MDPKKVPDDGFAAVPEGMNAPNVPHIPVEMGTAPEPLFDGSVCLRNTEPGKDCCAYLWQLVTNFSHGNTKGTFEEGKEPKAVFRSCIRSPSEELDLKGLHTFSCSVHSDPNCRENPVPFDFSKPESKPGPKKPNAFFKNLPVIQVPKKD